LGATGIDFAVAKLASELSGNHRLGVIPHHHNTKEKRALAVSW